MTELKEEVKKAIEGGEPAPQAEPSKIESSPEVKVEEPKTPKVEDDTLIKLSKQVENLNKALSEERQDKKTLEERIRKEFESKFDVVDKITKAINPEKQEEPETPKYLTEQEVQKIIEQKELERKRQTEEEKRVELIQSEVKILEQEFDGTEGKPKYDDAEVLKWQKDNERLYLSPKEAFYIMKKDDLIQYEISKKIKTSPPVGGHERPGASPNEHIPSEVKPKNDQELKNAIREAIEGV